MDRNEQQNSFRNMQTQRGMGKKLKEYKKIISILAVLLGVLVVIASVAVIKAVQFHSETEKLKNGMTETVTTEATTEAEEETTTEEEEESTTEAVTETTTETTTEATTETVTETTTEATTEAVTETTTEATTEAVTETTTEAMTETVTETTTETTTEATETTTEAAAVTVTEAETVTTTDAAAAIEAKAENTQVNSETERTSENAETENAAAPADAKIRYYVRGIGTYGEKQYGNQEVAEEKTADFEKLLVVGAIYYNLFMNSDKENVTTVRNSSNEELRALFAGSLNKENEITFKQSKPEDLRNELIYRLGETPEERENTAAEAMAVSDNPDFMTSSAYLAGVQAIKDYLGKVSALAGVELSTDSGSLDSNLTAANCMDYLAAFAGDTEETQAMIGGDQKERFKTLLGTAQNTEYNDVIQGILRALAAEGNENTNCWIEGKSADGEKVILVIMTADQDGNGYTVCVEIPAQAKDGDTDMTAQIEKLSQGIAEEMSASVAEDPQKPETVEGAAEGSDLPQNSLTNE